MQLSEFMKSLNFRKQKYIYIFEEKKPKKFNYSPKQNKEYSRQSLKVSRIQTRRINLYLLIISTDITLEPYRSQFIIELYQLGY